MLEAVTKHKIFSQELCFRQTLIARALEKPAHQMAFESFSKEKIELERNVVTCKVDFFFLGPWLVGAKQDMSLKSTTANCQLNTQIIRRSLSQSIWVTLRTSDHQFPEQGLQKISAVIAGKSQSRELIIFT